MRLTRAQKQQKTRGELLVAGRRRIAELGYARTSVDAIAESAGYSKGAIYSAFGSKEALAVALAESLSETYVEYLSRTVRSTSPAAFLEEAIAVMERAADDPFERLLPLELLSQAGRDAALRDAVAISLERRWTEYERIFRQVVEEFGGKPVASLRHVVEIILAVRHGHSLMAGGGVRMGSVRRMMTLLLPALLGFDPGLLTGHAANAPA